MISPHTPPGTKVVCIDDSGNCTDGDPVRNWITKGDVYTIWKWVNPTYVLLQEMPFFNGEPVEVSRERLRRLELPSVLTDALTSQPLVSKREVEPA